MMAENYKFHIYMILVVFAFRHTSAEHEELGDLAPERSVKEIFLKSCQISGFVSNKRRVTTLNTFSGAKT